MKSIIIAVFFAIFCIASIYAIYPYYSDYERRYDGFNSRYGSRYPGYDYRSPYEFYGPYRGPNKYDYGRSIFGARSGYY